MPSGVENNRETNCGKDTPFNQEKIDVQGENLPEQRALFETTTKKSDR